MSPTEPSTALDRLRDFLETIPAVSVLSVSPPSTAPWWIKLRIDIAHPYAWRVVQELAHVLNYVSLEERLPTVFKPVSPPPYMNGGPELFLSWMIEASQPDVRPELVLGFLEGRLPRPVTDPNEWVLELDE